MLRPSRKITTKTLTALATLALTACGPMMSTAHAQAFDASAPQMVLEDETGEMAPAQTVGDFSTENVGNTRTVLDTNTNSGCAISSSYNIDGSRLQVCQLVNGDRANSGLASLQIDARLSLVAQAFAQDMYTRGYFSHVTPSGGTMEDRMRNGGVQFGWAGENIARGQASPTEVNTSWMNSPGHRANILQSHYRKVGIGRVGNVWVEEFSD